MLPTGLRCKNDDLLDKNAVQTKWNKLEWKEFDGFAGCSLDDFNNTNQSPISCSKNSLEKELPTPLSILFYFCGELHVRLLHAFQHNTF